MRRLLKPIMIITAISMITSAFILNLISPCDKVWADGNIPIDEDHFPDENFRQWVLDNADATPDGVLTKSEIKQVTQINCSDSYIEDLTGIKYFSYIQCLRCNGNLIRELDVSGLKSLEYLDCSSNIISSLNVSGCIKLKHGTDIGWGWWPEGPCYHNGDSFATYGNKIKTLNCSGCISLDIHKVTDGDVDQKNLEHADFSGCIALKELDLSENQLKSLDLTGCTALENLYVSGNSGFDTIDLSECESLKWFDCSDCHFTSLDLSNNTKLTSLNCCNNKLTSLNLSANKVLEELFCNNNSIKKLNVSDMKALAYIDCSDNEIVTFNASGCTKLDVGGGWWPSGPCNHYGDYLELNNNPIKTLYFSGCTNLKEYDASKDNLGTVTNANFSGCAALKELYLIENQLKTLNISGCSSLEELDVYDNQLSSINTADCKKLTKLDCRYNFIILEPSAPGASVEYAPQKIVAKVTGLTGKNDDSCVSLSWKDVDGSSGYQIWRSTSENGTYSLIETTEDTSYNDYSVNEGKTYYYKIRAYLDHGERYYGNYSDVKKVSVPKPVTPTDKPTNTPTTKPTTTTPTTKPTVTPTQKPTANPTTKPTAKPTSNPTPTPSTETGVAGFVERLYTVAMRRPSDPNGKAAWIDAITSGRNTGADAAKGFLYSTEFTNKGLSDEEFVKTLYRTFFDREADQGGLDAWVGVLAKGDSRESVIDGFINSTEWANLCLDYGILSGGTGVPNKHATPSQGTIDFCTRLYTTCLSRSADQNGLMAWAQVLADQKETGTGAAHGFFFSKEFTEQNVSNKEYVTRLYRTFMDREPDQAGFDAWVGQLDQGVSREEVFNGFAQSTEFGKICAEYGIRR